LTLNFFKSSNFDRHNSTFFQEGLVAWMVVFFDDVDDYDDGKKKKTIMMRK